MITTVEPGSRAEAGEPRFALGIPGMPNLHSHAFQRGMAGLSEVRGHASDNFWTWREVMYRFLALMTPDDVQAIAAMAYLEMLESGFTRVGEFHYLHHQPDGRPYDDPAEMAAHIGAAAEETGIGLTLLPCFYAHGNFGGAPASPGQRRFLNNLDAFARLYEASRAVVRRSPGGTIGVAPHSLRAVAPAELAAVVALAGDAPVHIHVAEQTREVEDSLAWSGRRPVEWLLAHAPVDNRWCIIHATHMTPDEGRALAGRGAVAGLCPLTEANLGDGTFDAATWFGAGGRLGIGTDSNIMVGVAAELRQLEYAQRLSRRARNVLAGALGRSTGRSVFEAAVQGGAHALGLDRSGLAAGGAADLVALDVEHPSLAGEGGDRLLDGWIFAAADSAVDAVWVRGRQLVAGGRHVARDRLARRYKGVLRRLQETEL